MTISSKSTSSHGHTGQITLSHARWYCGLTSRAGLAPKARPCAEGTAWNIPEHDLDRALATLRRQDRQFRQRIKKAAMYLTAKDAEAIIALATHGIVRLELLEQPIHMSHNSNYL